MVKKCGCIGSIDNTQATGSLAKKAGRHHGRVHIWTASGQWPGAGHDLWFDRGRLQHGLRCHWHDQFCPRRCLHDFSLYHRYHAQRLGLFRGCGAGADPAYRLAGSDVRYRGVWLGHRARCLSSAARFASADTADFGYWRVFVFASLCAACPGSEPARDQALPGRCFSHLDGGWARPLFPDYLYPVADSAGGVGQHGGVGLPDWLYQSGAVLPCHATRPEDGYPAGHRHQPHHFHCVCDWCRIGQHRRFSGHPQLRLV
ncbi:hypothetical protein GALL_526730 [mine drainage metagenome]|uniref:Uncharacterized protein n=1 Tax=mine drainage metagenome TaxID=410659 RepID=A0A1J5PE12_9ZZZZ